jgi:hypothetical protein
MKHILRKQLLLKLGVFLLLGVVVNVAVAWALAWVIYPVGIFSKANLQVNLERTTVKDWTVRRQGGSSALKVVSVWIDADGAQQPHFQVPLDRSGQKPPPWAGFLVPEESKTFGTQHFREAFAFGWPTLSLWWGRSLDFPFRDMNCFTRPPAYEQFNCIRLSSGWYDSAGGGFPFERALPLSPIFSGFAINTIFYAAMLWLLWFAPGKIRRFIIVRGRIRRHRCPACGYQIAPGGGIGPVCSECGAALPAAWSTNASS